MSDETKLMPSSVSSWNDGDICTYCKKPLGARSFPALNPVNEWVHHDCLPWVKKDETVLEEAARIVDGAREADYGNAKRNFGDISELWSTYLGHEVTPRNVAMMMVLLKVARDKHKAKRDNLVDAAGYARCAEMLEK